MKYFVRQLQVRHFFFRIFCTSGSMLAIACHGDTAAQLAKEVGLPLYLHSRDTNGDFCRVMASAGRGDDP
jgi:hypothetical protein